MVRARVEKAATSEDLASLAHAYYLLHLALHPLGSPERAAFRGLALPIYEELGDLLGQANVLNNLGIDAYYEGRWDEALDLYGRSREARQRIGDVVGAATITNNIGEIESDQGHLDEAEAAFRQAYDVCLAAGTRSSATSRRATWAGSAARAGRLDEAETSLGEALAGFEEIRAAGFVLETRRASPSATCSPATTSRRSRRRRDTLAGDRGDGVGRDAAARCSTGCAPTHLRNRATSTGWGGCAPLTASTRLARPRRHTRRRSPSRQRRAWAELRGERRGGAAAQEAQTLLARLGVVSTPKISL